MQKLKIGSTILLLVILIAAATGSTPVLAQEGDGFTETFNDSTLPGWEHAREAVVVDGVLRMDPGSFALHVGDWSDITLSIRVRFSGEGEVMINYYFREGNRYGLIFNAEMMMLEKEQGGEVSSLGRVDESVLQPDTWFTLEIVVSGQDHQISVDDQVVLTATDPNSLDTGAFLLQAMGGVTVEFDDLTVRGTPGGGPPPGEEQPPEGEPAAPPAEGESVAPTVTAPTTQSQPTGFLEEFFASQASQVELTTFLINLVWAAICAFILSLIYIHWGTSLSNRRKFASNFMLMTITTTFIILVVRSSVALSLGLVGALSIVRFRTAVKEPEELAYLFFAIGIGIGLGDNQRLITLLALVAGIVILGLIRLFRRPDADVNLHLTVASRNPEQVNIDGIMNALHPHVSKMKLLRFDENPESLEAGFLVEFRKGTDLSQARNALKALSEKFEITFMDNKGIW